ncbi:MAG: sulfatase [Acidobacteria bacterium]|nr:sulfatase [Acidobacteriota bacterium]
MRCLRPIVGAATAIIVAVSCSSSPGRRGVLLITLDAVRADHLSCYGYHLKTTPFIDELATQGVRFDQAIAVSSNTPVTHASLLTGLYPARHGLRFIHGYQAHQLGSGIVTIARVFSKAGFKTAAFVSAFPLTARRSGLQSGFDVYDDDIIRNETSAISPDGKVRIKENQRSGDETISHFLDWLTREKPRRFFAWVHLFDAHDLNIKPPEEFMREFEKKAAIRYPNEPVRHRHYDSEIAYIDLLLRRMREKMKPVIPWEDLQVVIVSDHGDGLGDHGYERHTSRIYQEQIRVPLIISGPGLPRGMRISSEVSTVDVAPTLLAINNLLPPVRVDGRSLLPMMQGSAPSRACYAEALSAMLENQPPLFAVVKDGKKLIYAPTEQRFELYDLRKDPAELANLASDVAHAGLRDALFKELQNYPLTIDLKPGDALTAEDTEKLRALGYL